MATKTPTLQVDERVTRAAARAKDLAPDADIASLELSSRRTGMSFQRTRMSADRTLMSVIRTALSLITFGFTLYQFFERLVDSAVIRNANAGRNFGLALVVARRRNADPRHHLSPSVHVWAASRNAKR